MRIKRWPVLVIALAAGAIGALFLINSPGANALGALNSLTEEPPLDRANIGLGERLSDEEIRLMLDEYEVEPVAAYVSIHGIHATHRAYEDSESSEDFLQTARAELIESFENTVKSSVFRMERLLEQHSEEELANDEQLQNEMKSLLNLHSNYRLALKAARNNEPLVYSLEVVSNTDEEPLERLRTDERIKEFAESFVVNGEVVLHRTQRPEAYNERFVDLEVRDMTSEEAYRRTTEYVSTSGSTENTGPVEQ